MEQRWMPRFKAIINDLSTPRKWRGGTPLRSIFSPSICVGHSRVANYITIIYESFRSLTKPTFPPFAPISSRAREPPPRIYTGHISDPEVPMV
ncbi:hypothetical protein AVEN_178016-1 [Araneus ventricosus]|uniref:Uncharacterized protein n=1 Tax=Araneus ventricosus TaxID=182803 RepID=A0A4Y2K313_ARAVE|nr:hypothetical protein AVEN_178016-1 [Araneus ventricosus]